MSAYRTLYLYYQSLDDWREEFNILHAAPKFHGRPRYDCALLDGDTGGSTIGRQNVVRLRGMFRCELRSGRKIDLALVRRFKPSKWRPKTAWDDIQVDVENKHVEFMLMDSFLRGVRMNPAFGSPKGGTKGSIFYLDDCTDCDIYLRVQGLTC